MKELGDWVKKARTTVVVDAYTSPHMSKINPTGFPDDFFSDGSQPEDFTYVTVKTRSGFDAPKSHFEVVRKDKVKDFIGQNFSGKEIEAVSMPKEIEAQSPEFSMLVQLGDDDNWMGAAYSIFEYVGILENPMRTSTEVLDSWDLKKKEWAKEKYDENWIIVLQTEFALHNFPLSSAVGYAARLFYCYYIEQDDYSVGYLWRELELLMKQEMEIASFQEEADRKRYGSKKGGKATQEKMNALRIDCLKLVANAYDWKGSDFLGESIQGKAEIIREIALAQRPKAYLGPKGAPLSGKWFIETLEGFKADGRLGKALEDAVKRNKA